MQHINKILVIRLSSIGDIILTTPLLRSLNLAWPEARIDYCTKAPFVPLLSANPRITTIYTTEQPPSGAYDLVVDLQNNLRSHAIVRGLRALRVVRYRKENWKKWLLVQCKINVYGTCTSVVDRYLDSVKEFGVSGDLQGCELYPTSGEQAFALPYFKTGRKTLALCFGAKHLTKRYPPHRFAAIILSCSRSSRCRFCCLEAKRMPARHLKS